MGNFPWQEKVWFCVSVGCCRSVYVCVHRTMIIFDDELLLICDCCVD